MATEYSLKSSSSSSSVVVVMVPFPQQSHLNQLLQLSHVISSYDNNNIHAHYVASTLHKTLVNSRSPFRSTLHNQEFNSTTSIQFHEFPIPQNLTAAPPDLLAASPDLRRFITDLIRSLSSSARRVVIVHDVLMGSVIDDDVVVSIPNVESYGFNCISAFTSFTFLSESSTDHNHEFCTNNYYNKLSIPARDECFPPEVNLYLDSFFQSMKARGSGDLYNTCRSIENTFLDLLADDNELRCKKRVWAVGPLHRLNSNISDNGHECLRWLNDQEPNTVLYVSFGTTVSMLDKQIEEIALGLEQSGEKFIWVLRDADKGDVFDEGVVGRPQLPDGFEERVRGMGMVVREWAPQVEILGHPSTGGFMSHCGWNSCLESISMGVPIAAWPMCADQPRNAVLITEVLKVGLEVREWRKRKELVSSEVIEKVVERLMRSDEGVEIRKRAEELGGEVWKSVAEGGVTRGEWDSFIAHITRS
ncbi:UDP-glucuronosyl/UDP-glucosyltransferase [Trema orientale]|uniref:Glycosyltransferase n=1 Tax=Trema orientale TaxID=63057 RepID=A0A2P5EMB8_TREOI|nr:UDP-glucuronosyl/UDP-glucosyltransferase [Trema orientale]